MEYFYSDGGNNRPHFIYRFTVRQESLVDMMNWAMNYPEKGPFSRYHVVFNSQPSKDNSDSAEILLIQFELRDAYLAFKYAFAGEILEDKTLMDYRV